MDKQKSNTKIGWLVNDCLTCIPNTKTFWHNLLDWMPNLIDKTNTYTNYIVLANVVEHDAQNNGNPYYIIRNATFFRKLNIDTKTVCLLQDYYENENYQVDVCNNADVVVFNSPFTYSFYKDKITTKTEIIPLGVDFDHFKPSVNYSDELGILPNSVLFVGAYNNYPKGFDIVSELIKNTDLNFCLVMKDDFTINHPRVKCFNKVSQDIIVKIYNSCKVMLCTSRMETQHLSGIEAGACGLPIVATNVGIYFNLDNGKWGRKAYNASEFNIEINYVLDNYDTFTPRQYFLENKFDTKSCEESWKKLINEL